MRILVFDDFLEEIIFFRIGSNKKEGVCFDKCDIDYEGNAVDVEIGVNVDVDDDDVDDVDGKGEY